MSTAAELREKISALIKELEVVVKDESLPFEQVESRSSELELQIRELEQSLEDLLEAEEKRKSLQAKIDQRKADLKKIVVASNDEGKPARISVEHKSFEDGLKKVFGERHALGRYLQTIKANSFNDRSAADKLFELRDVVGMSAQDAESGGFLLGTTDGGRIAEEAIETGVFSSQARRVPLDAGTDMIEFLEPKHRNQKEGYRFGGVRVYWTGEGETITQSQIEMTKSTYRTWTVAAAVTVTGKLMNNAAALEAEILQSVPQSIAFELDKVIWEGTGIGQPLGIKNAGSLITIAKESAQTADTIEMKNLIKMMARSLGMGNPIWYANVDTLPQLMQLKNADDSPAFLNLSQSATGPISGTLFGRPLRFTDHCETLGDLGDIALLDLNYYRILDPDSTRVDQSMHVYFLSDQNVFRFIKTYGGGPVYSKPLTPLKGSTTRSEFVVLAARA